MTTRAKVAAILAPHWLWRLVPLSVRSRWSPRDNWQRGYLAGMDAGLRRAEGRVQRGERIR